MKLIRVGLRLQITRNTVFDNVSFGEAGSILDLIKENPANRAISTFQLQPLIIRTLVPIDGRLNLSRSLV